MNGRRPSRDAHHSTSQQRASDVLDLLVETRHESGERASATWDVVRQGIEDLLGAVCCIPFVSLGFPQGFGRQERESLRCKQATEHLICRRRCQPVPTGLLIQRICHDNPSSPTGGPTRQALGYWAWSQAVVAGFPVCQKYMSTSFMSGYDRPRPVILISGFSSTSAARLSSQNRRTFSTKRPSFRPPRPRL